MNHFERVKDVSRRHWHIPKIKLGEAPDVQRSIIAICKSSYLNVLLLFIPLSWLFRFLKIDSILTFVFSFLAIVGLAKLHDFATNDVRLRLGQTLAGLFDSTLGNTVELAVAIIALVKCELAIVQFSLVGSILNNLLLVLGVCLFAGGTRFSEQGFGIGTAQLNTSLLTLSVIAIVIPAAFHNAVQSSDGIHPLTDAQEGHDLLSISHGVAIILLFVWLCYLVFQSFSHKNLYDDPNSDIPQSIAYDLTTPTPSPAPRANDTMGTENAQLDTRSAEAGLTEEDEAEVPQMGIRTAIALLVGLTVIVGITAECLVDAIDGLTQNGRIGKGFVGLILLPILGNVPEHVTAVTVSVKDKLTLSLALTVGSTIQITTFVIPFIVTLGWILGKPFTLHFDPFVTIVLSLAVVAVNYVVQDGKSNWLEGMILICLYAVVAVMFWYYPVSDSAGILATCQ